MTTNQQAQTQETQEPETEQDVMSWFAAGRSGGRGTPQTFASSRARQAIEGHGESTSETPVASEDEADELAEKAQAEPKPEEKPRIDKGMAALKRKERAIRSREATLTRTQQELLAERELLQKDPYEFMRRHGLSARDLAQRAVKESEPENPQTALERKLAAQEKELEEIRLRHQTAEEAAEEQQSIQIVSSVITERAADYPFLQDENPREVLKALEHVWERDYKPAGQQLDAETLRELLTRFETNLRTKAQKLARRLTAKKPSAPVKQAAAASPSTGKQTRLERALGKLRNK